MLRLISNFKQNAASWLEVESPESFRSHVVRLFRLLGIPVLVFFTIQDFSMRRWDEGVFTLAILIMFIATSRLDITAHHSKNFFRIGMGMLTANFIYLLAVNSETYLVGLWMYLIPLPVALLFGVKEGAFWIVFSCLGAITALEFSPLHPPIPPAFVFRFGLTYFGLGLLSLGAEHVRERTQRLYLSKQQELELLNERISGKVLLDPLTGGFNREFMTELLPGILTHSTEADTPLSIILCDIDRFKEINDNFGHVVGDEILKKTAAVLSDNLRRGTDHLVRYGGDEFLIVLRNTTSADAAQLAERLRVKILEQQLEIGNFSVTCSFGVTELLNADFDDMQKTASTKLIARADQCLYQAKDQGKNRVVFAFDPQD